MTIASDTIPVAGKDRLDEASLTAWMEANVAGFTGPLTYAKFAGGQSNPTYRIDSPSGAYVLRRKPFGVLLPSAHAVDREFRVQEALAKTDVPVPKVLMFTDDRSVIGTPFYLMERLRGRIFWSPTLPEVPKEDRAAIYEGMIDALKAVS